MSVIVPEVVAPPPPVGLMAMKGSHIVGRQDLLGLDTPEGTATHKPIAHAEVVQTLIECLGLRKIGVVADSYALSKDTMRMFGVMNLDLEGDGIRFTLGLRNSHDKSFSLGLTVGYKVVVCDNLMFNGAFTTTARKHTSGCDLVETLALAVERCQRGFEPMQRRVDAWKGYDLSDDKARRIIYAAFIERAGIDLPRHLAPAVHKAYFEPTHEAFSARSLWSMENAFTEALKALDPIPMIEATAKLPAFLGRFA